MSKTEALDRVEYFLTHGDRPQAPLCIRCKSGEKLFSAA
ncbi:conserved hypothetical protein [delta proteobacterium NaphS2]|nr:conserved hypothetical protein [delta proteobacterium NaphS2]